MSLIRSTSRFPNMREENGLRAAGYSVIAGLDEAGRGPIAGPVVAGAAVLPHKIEGDWSRLIRDSKKLTPAQRESALLHLSDTSALISTGAASAVEIDRIGIVPAVRLAMARAIETLPLAPDFLLLDAFPLPDSNLPQKAIVKGDSSCMSIAAASIAAKVERDRVMCELDEEFPGYGLAIHKGYCTNVHIEALNEIGPSSIHRITFAPVRKSAEARGVFVKRLNRLLIKNPETSLVKDIQISLPGIEPP